MWGGVDAGYQLSYLLHVQACARKPQLPVVVSNGPLIPDCNQRMSNDRIGTLKDDAQTPGYSLQAALPHFLPRVRCLLLLSRVLCHASDVEEI